MVDLHDERTTSSHEIVRRLKDVREDKAILKAELRSHGGFEVGGGLRFHTLRQHEENPSAGPYDFKDIVWHDDPSDGSPWSESTECKTPGDRMLERYYAALLHRLSYFESSRAFMKLDGVRPPSPASDNLIDNEVGTRLRWNR